MSPAPPAPKAHTYGRIQHRQTCLTHLVFLYTNYTRSSAIINGRGAQWPGVPHYDTRTSYDTIAGDNSYTFILDISLPWSHDVYCPILVNEMNGVLGHDSILGYTGSETT